MSRIGKQPILIPAGVEAKITGQKFSIKGPKGELSKEIHPLVNVRHEDDQLIISVKNSEEKRQRSLWGLFRRLIANMVLGVTEGFSKKLEINGIGYKGTVSGDTLILKLGYSHPIEFQIPKGIEIKVEKNMVTIFGSDKQLVGNTAAEIRALRKPEPYKGKGIKYSTEISRRKAGKTAMKDTA